jgi:eukaryotic-like serine/threonine-protein kinase
VFENPMLQSDILLAGANSSSVTRSESHVTALELSDLDLDGTELAILSACDSALGVIEPGQGVYGLRRGLAIAGAKRVVLSLWKVDDEATRQLMLRLYDSAVSKNTLGDSLWQAQKTLQRSETWSHPYYWSGFMFSGEDTAIPDLTQLRSPSNSSTLSASNSATTPPAPHDICQTRWVFAAAHAQVPVLANGRLVVGTKERIVYALDAITGHERWHLSAQGEITSTPVATDTAVYLGNQKGTVYALDMQNGGQEWRFDTNAWISAMYASDGVIYAGTGAGDLYALNLRSGREIWEFSVDNAGFNWANLAHIPAIYWVEAVEGRLYVGDSQGGFYCLSPRSGRRLWKVTFPDGLSAPPSVDGGLAFLTSNDRFIYALGYDSHQLEWKYFLNGDSWVAPIIIGKQLVTVVSDELLTALDPRTGQTIWQYQLYDTVETGLRIQNGDIYFGGIKGLYMFDTHVGESRLLEASPTITSTPIIWSGMIYYSNINGELHGLECH